jgi:hypothetical protein
VTPFTHSVIDSDPSHRLTDTHAEVATVLRQPTALETPVTAQPASIAHATHRAAPALLLSLLLLALPAAQGESSNPDPDAAIIERSGNLLQWGVPLLGLGLTYLLDRQNDTDDLSWRLTDVANTPGLTWPGPRLDQSPRHDFLVSFLRMEVTTYALKYAINAKRPNGNGQSFPSGHAASAFMGAEFIRKHYGLGWGIPAYGAAAWVGYSRVESRKHYWRDVVGGALVGIAANYDLPELDTPLGQLSLGPALMMTAHPTAWICELRESRSCVNDTATLSPGLRLKLRFR